jgi:putative transposase
MASPVHLPFSTGRAELHPPTVRRRGAGPATSLRRGRCFVAGYSPAVAQDIRTIFYAPDLHEANRLLGRVVESWSKRAPRLAEWMEANLPEGLAVLSLPVPHRKRMRTTNMLKRLNRELKRRTRVATLFPNEASLLRLTTAVLAEVTEDWETNRIYLNMEAD